MLQLKSANRLRAVLVGDIHDDINDVHRLLKEDLRDIDVVLCYGDLTTAPDRHLTTSEEVEFEQRAEAVLDALRGFNKPIIIVPGNHDPAILFNCSRTASVLGMAGVQNAHGRALPLAPGLSLLGWGGSSAAIEAGKTVWNGWPYMEREVGEGYAQLKQAEALLGDHSVLLLTHCGPAGVGTTSVTTLDPNCLDEPGVRESVIDSGSPALRQFLSSSHVQERGTILVHGHTHAGVGSASVGRVPVVNAGSLRYGSKYGVLTLEQHLRADGTQRWRMQSLQLSELATLDGSSGRGWRESNGNQGAALLLWAALLVLALVCLTGLWERKGLMAF